MGLIFSVIIITLIAYSPLLYVAMCNIAGVKESETRLAKSTKKLFRKILIGEEDGETK